jgi:anti-sigma-K factor RskA
VRVADLEEQVQAGKKEYQLQIASAQTLSKEMQAKLDKFMRSEQYAMAGQEQPKVQGKFFWDKAENTLTVMATNVAPPEAGKTYELWGITADGAKMPMGTAEPDASGKIVMEVKVPALAAGMTIAAFTDEPAGGLPAPTGKIQFLGTLAKQ